MNNSALSSCRTDTSLEWRRRPFPPSIVIENVICEREAPSRPDISSFATSGHADGDQYQPVPPSTGREEVPESSHIESPPAKDLAGLSDPLEDPQEHSNESDPTLVDETDSLPDPQVIYEAPQASNDDNTCQDTTEREEAPESSRIKCPLAVDLVVPSDPLKDHQDLPNESVPTLIYETISSPELQKPNEALRVSDEADRRFDQLYIYSGEVFQDLTLQEMDEVNFVRKENEVDLQMSTIE